MSIHDQIINESCSHIVVRKKIHSIGMEIRGHESDTKKYYCSCELENAFGRK